jgi:hypothetical protein
MGIPWSVATRLGAVALGASLWAGPALPAPQQVDVKLVMATDVSMSMRDDAFATEREGTAAAFEDPAVIRGIQNGALGRIAVTMFDFSQPETDKVVVPWMIIHDRASAAAFADAVRNAPRTDGRHTSISSALQFGALMLNASDKDIVGTRRVIDVTGDGPNNFGDPEADVHEMTIASGIVVNGLPVMDDYANNSWPDLDKYYAACVAGGRGSFVISVHSYKDYSAAMRRKLILEISENDAAVKEAEAKTLQQRSLVRRVAETRPPVQRAPEVLQAGPNEFSKQCDIQGRGYGGNGGYGGNFYRY